MSKGKKVLFTVLLVLFVGASVYMSFNMISRPTYEFEQQADGWHLTGFNGNANTAEVHIDHPMVRHGSSWEPDLTAEVTAVDKFTFVSDEYVQYIYIGPSVTQIDEQAFVYCKQLRAVFVDDANPNYKDIDGVLYTKDGSTVLLYPICYCTHLVYSDIETGGAVSRIGLDVKETFTVPGKTADEQFEAFHTYCKNNGEDFGRALFDEMLARGVMAPYIGTYYIIKEQTADGLTLDKAWSCDEVYTIPEGVTRVAADAFYKCDRLTAITLPSTVKSIGEMAFFKCYNTAMVTLPDGLETLGNDAFSFCWSMKYAMFIPESVESIGHHAFYKCDGLTEFYMGDADESTISLGGRWQPRSDNAFKAKPPVWGKTRADCDAFNAPLYAADAEKAAAEAAAQANAPAAATQDKSGTEINRTAVFLLIALVFVPGMLFIGVQVVRNMFYEEFLMTKRGKARFRKEKARKEELHREFLARQNQAAGEDAAADTDDEKGRA